jgi:hypothetical protein
VDSLPVSSSVFASDNCSFAASFSGTTFVTASPMEDFVTIFYMYSALPLTD